MQTKVLAVVSGVLIIALIIGGVIIMNNGSNNSTDDLSVSPSPTAAAVSKELKIEDQTVGTGDEAVVGKSVTVNYKGTLTDGTEFDSSYGRNQPFSFNLGSGQVIQGWEQGVQGMKVGGKRKLTIPPSLGYGAQATGKIPANSTLIFEIELLSVK
jgi:FKBP-type peptidyl-prolyl cis-trans isomerase